MGSYRKLQTREGRVALFRRWRVRASSYVSSHRRMSKLTCRGVQIVLGVRQGRLRPPVPHIRHLRLRRDDPDVQANGARRDRGRDGRRGAGRAKAV